MQKDTYIKGEDIPNTKLTCEEEIIEMNVWIV